jgi:hypothetical protein
MALRFLESFDHLAWGDITEKWTARSGFGSGSFGFTTGRNGNCLYMEINSGFNAALQKWFTVTGGDTCVIGVALKFPSAYDCTILQIYDSSSPQITLNENSDGSLDVFRGDNATLLGATAPGTMSTGTWYFVELKVLFHQSAGTVDLYVNGANVLSLTSQDTCATANESWNGFTLRVSAAGTNRVEYDDLYVLDGTGGVNDDVRGDCRVKALFPDGAGNYSEFTPSAGSNFQNVDEAEPDDDTTYNESTAIGQKDSFTFDDLAGGLTAAIYGVQASISGKKDDAGPITINSFVRISGTDYDGDAHYIGLAYQCWLHLWDQNPETVGNWSVSDINSIEAGYEHAT